MIVFTEGNVVTLRYTDRCCLGKGTPRASYALSECSPLEDGNGALAEVGVSGAVLLT